IMKRKNLTRAASLADPELFKLTKEGIPHIVRNATYLSEYALKVAEIGGRRASAILEDFASEEAAKVLILFDLVRCPRSSPEWCRRQIKHFYSHLSRRIYAEYYQSHFTDFDDVKSWVDVKREAYYTDGDEYCHFISDNAILRQREEKLYVDYINDGDDDFWNF